MFLGECLRHVLGITPQVPTSFAGSVLMQEGMWQRKVDSVCPVWSWPQRRPQREEAYTVFQWLKGEMETIFPMRERSCCIATVHIFSLLHIHSLLLARKGGHGHLFLLISSTAVSELSSPLGDEHFTLLLAGHHRRPCSSLHSTPCQHLCYGLLYFAKLCTGHLTCWHNEFLWRMAFQNGIFVKSTVTNHLKTHMGSKFCLSQV